ncbi:YbjN domain-containing protein [Paracoccus sp. MBLB3053]|uniref:YbjN domain-containing protein n=1 Tax=Paracoccus aurantius TaxID=3073814 RepID=A0ABU2HNU6_9RHOB|nr:YbjN domain-containing protein [Paracoccus sp. MBLB3053]MDS9466708.1 YbjN domain-containing protein [Paracoccus sp. MBLB3053]
MRALCAYLIAVSLQSMPLAAAQVTGDPEIISKIMTELGLEVTQGQDVEGLPMLESEVDDTLFNVFFYECKPQCRRMQFVTGFQMSEPMTPEDANDWNRDNPFGKLVVAESGNPYLEMDIGLAGDGLGRENFEDALATWRAVLGDFRAAITD